MGQSTVQVPYRDTCNKPATQLNRKNTMKLRNLVPILLLSPLWFTAPAQAENPEHVKQLLETKWCQECDLSGADLSGADLRDAFLFLADLEGTNLSRANLRGAYFFRADLSDANLSQALLPLAVLRDARVSGTDLEGANLIGADIGEIDLGDAELNQTTLPDGTIAN